MGVTIADGPRRVDVCDQCQRHAGAGQTSRLLQRSVPRMGTRLGLRPQRTGTACACVRTGLDVVDGGAACPATASLSDSENSTATLTKVEFHRAWSSDGDATAAAVESLSSSEGNSASELSPGAGPRTCSGTSTAGQGSGSPAAARRLAYEQFARVMYTNRANLQHTIAVQQRLFQQQLARPAFHDYINAALGPPPLPPRPRKVNEGGCEGDRSNGQSEWVVRRRADGTRYITRRPSTSRHRSKRPHDVTPSSADRKDAARKPAAGKTQGSVRKDGSRRKEVDATTADAAPERMKEQSQPLTSKSATAFHNVAVTSPWQSHQHPILAVITI